ncbi:MULTISPECIES: hypothetical protein [unclassified Imperialibacter]|nr:MULTISPECIES: hypothetical protein [unclassified Imperialibacter]
MDHCQHRDETGMREGKVRATGEKKVALIEAMNPEWRDLFDTLE